MTTEGALSVPTIEAFSSASDPRRGSLVSSLGEIRTNSGSKGSRICPNRRSQNVAPSGCEVWDGKQFRFDSKARFEVILDCSSWACPVCSWKKAQNVRRLLEGGLTHQLAAGRSCVHLVITEPADFRSYKESAKALSDLMNDGLNKWYSRSTDGPLKRIPYVAVPELQDRGAPHWHLNLAGLCAPWDHKRSLTDFEFDGPVRSGSLCRFSGLEGVAVSRSQTLLPMLARHGFGLQQGKQLRQIGADGSDARGVAGYMSKGLGAYMSKAVGTARALPKGASMVRGSKGAAAWWPGHSLESIRDDARKWSRLSRSQEVERAEIQGS